MSCKAKGCGKGARALTDADVYCEGHLRVLRRRIETFIASLGEAARSPLEWTVLGDNWLGAWNMARRCEKDHGIDHQDFLRIVHVEHRVPMAETAR